MADEARLDPGATYGPDDLVVATDLDLPGREGPGHAGERLPAREVVYEILRERGPLTLTELARQYTAVPPGGIRPPYDEVPEVYVLRLVAGRRAGRALATLEDLVRRLARDPGADPDYGFELRPA